MYIYIYIQAYLSGHDQALTKPGRPLFPAQEPKRVAFGSFGAAAREGGTVSMAKQGPDYPLKGMPIFEICW